MEEEVEEEAPQLHPLHLHPVPGLQEEVVKVADHPLPHLLRHLPHQQQPQILRMTNLEETRHKSSQETGKKVDVSYLNFNSIEA